MLPYDHLGELYVEGVFVGKGIWVLDVVGLNVQVVFVVEVFDQGVEVDLCGLFGSVEEEGMEKRDEDRLVGSELCLRLELFEEWYAYEKWPASVRE